MINVEQIQKHKAKKQKEFTKTSKVMDRVWSWDLCSQSKIYNICLTVERPGVTSVMKDTCTHQSSLDAMNESIHVYIADRTLHNVVSTEG
jgi:hypothetical protein